MRRLIFWLVAGGAAARLYVLGQERSWAVVLPAAAGVTAVAFAAWAAHVVAHELGHLVAARVVGFHVSALRLGPVRFGLDGLEPKVSWAGLDLGGGLSSSPVGLAGLPQKLRFVALAGPVATLGLMTATLVWYQAAGAPGVASVPGIAATMGALVLVTALLPSWALPRRPPAGTDMGQVFASRKTLAHWVRIAILDGAERGQRVSQTATPEALEPYLPPEGVVEPVVLAWVVSCFELGQFERARPRLMTAVHPERSRRVPNTEDDLETNVEPWLLTDLNAQAGALAALVDGDVTAARRFLAEVRTFEALPWYGDLLEACIAEASKDEAERDAALERWRSAVDAHPRGRFARSGNDWILDALEQRRA